MGWILNFDEEFTEEAPQNSNSVKTKLLSEYQDLFNGFSFQKSNSRYSEMKSI